MSSPRIRVILTAALALLGACESKSTGPRAADSEVTIRAYVDADGDGAYSAADTPLSGVVVTLTATGTTLTATTDAAGLATFPFVPAGSYRASLGAEGPAGSVLATATAPIVVAPAFGAELSAEFRYVLNPGNLSGVIYRDDDASGSYESGTDTPAPGMVVELFRGEAAEGDPLDEATTDDAGSFAFGPLRPGAYTVRITPFPTTEIVGGTTRTVTVEAATTLDVPVEFTGSLVVPIAEARALLGRNVSVEGVVTWQVPFDSRIYFLQDETGGISTFDGSRPDLEIGDRIRITGTVGTFQNEVQISVTSREVLASGTPLMPEVATAAEINAGELQGQLVVVPGATVQNIDVQSFGNQLVTLNDATGATFAVWADSRTGVTATDWTVGQRYDVVGVLGTDARRNATYPHQIEVRGDADVQSTTTIAAARAMIGDTVAVTGTVVYQEPWGTAVIFLQDETGGISLFRSGAPAVVPGDRLYVRGRIGAFRGEVQFSSVIDMEVLGPGAAPTPRAVTGTQINAGQFQGELVRLTGTVTSIAQVNSFGTHMVTLTDGSGTAFNVYVDNRVGVQMSRWTVGQTYTLTGVLGADDRDNPDFRLEIRSAADIQG